MSYGALWGWGQRSLWCPLSPLIAILVLVMMFPSCPRCLWSTTIWYSVITAKELPFRVSSWSSSWPLDRMFPQPWNHLQQTLSFLSLESRMPSPFHSCVHAGPFPKNFFSILLWVYPNVTHLSQPSSGVPFVEANPALHLQMDSMDFRERAQNLLSVQHFIAIRLVVGLW